MPTFDFIADEQFRRVLEADREEMQRCADSTCWKAVHVLAGSIIEAVLLDHLVSNGHMTKTAALKADLGKAVELALAKTIISERVHGLSSVAREYRNLVHPGRSIRTAESPSAHSSHIVMSLLEMILEEIGSAQRTGSGYTAEQVVSKVERDSSVRGILKHLVRDINEQETERLLQEMIPTRYFDALEELRVGEDVPDHLFQMLSLLFRTAYDNAPERIQAAVTNTFVRILKEASEERVRTYCQQFFRMSDMKHLLPDNVQLVKAHYLDQIRSDKFEEEWIAALKGIGEHLAQGEGFQFADRIVTVACQFDQHYDVLSNRLFDEYLLMSDELQQETIECLDRRTKMYEYRDDKERANTVDQLKSYIEIPF
jgi:hypothetical protein